MKPYDLMLVYLNYTDQSFGKTRPVLLLQEQDGHYFLYKITSKFPKKSKTIQNQYCPIKFWKEAGLHKPSWIDTGNVAMVRCEEVQNIIIGHLSFYDIKELAAFLQQKHR